MNLCKYSSTSFLFFNAMPELVLSCWKKWKFRSSISPLFFMWSNADWKWCLGMGWMGESSVVEELFERCCVLSSLISSFPKSLLPSCGLLLALVDVNKTELAKSSFLQWVLVALILAVLFQPWRINIVKLRVFSPFLLLLAGLAWEKKNRGFVMCWFSKWAIYLVLRDDYDQAPMHLVRHFCSIVDT